MLSQQIKNELPADLLLNIMQYACYKTHDNAKMIKELLKNWNDGCRAGLKKTEKLESFWSLKKTKF